MTHQQLLACFQPANKKHSAWERRPRLPTSGLILAVGDSAGWLTACCWLLAKASEAAITSDRMRVVGAVQIELSCPCSTHPTALSALTAVSTSNIFCFRDSLLVLIRLYFSSVGFSTMFCKSLWITESDALFPLLQS